MMKKILIVIVAIVIAVPSFSQEATDVKTEKNVLKLNTLSLFVLTPVLSFMSVKYQI